MLEVQNIRKFEYVLNVLKLRVRGHVNLKFKRVERIDAFALGAKVEKPLSAAGITYPIPEAVMYNLVDYPLGTCHVYTYRI